MGSFCCCFHVPDVDEENADSYGTNNGGCVCFNLLIQNLKNKYKALFGGGGGGGGMHPMPSSDQGPASSHSILALNNSSESGSSPSAPVPSNSNRRYSHMQRDVVVSRHEKGSSHSRVEPEPLSESNVHVMPELLSRGEKSVGSYCEGESKECHSEYPVKVLPEKVESEVGQAYPSPEEYEDDCAICLEEYTQENPKIITQCSHHYHLGCIYDWMERSGTCPVCSKMMVFEEMT